MKLALAYFIGMSTASAWWAAAMWGYGGDHEMRNGLWAFPVVLTAFSLVMAVACSQDED